MKSIGFWLVIALFWGGLIFYFTTSGYFTSKNTEKTINAIISASSNSHAGELNFLGKSPNFIVRKLMHLTVFGIFALIIWKLLRPWRYSFLTAWTTASIYGGIDEWHQSLVPGRTPLLQDVLIDSTGAFLALCIAVFLQKMKEILPP